MSTQKTTKTKKNKLPTSSKKQKTTNEIFHYDYRQLLILAMFNIVLTCTLFVLSKFIAQNNIITTAIQFYMLVFVMVLTLLSLAGSLFVVISPLNLAIVTDETIKIDHNQPLRWEDIEIAKEFVVNCFFKRPVIVLQLKQGVEYKLTFMQKICKNHKFTAFSIPLYAMSNKEAEKIRKHIIKHCKYEKLYN